MLIFLIEDGDNPKCSSGRSLEQVRNVGDFVFCWVRGVFDCLGDVFDWMGSSLNWVRGMLILC